MDAPPAKKPRPPRRLPVVLAALSVIALLVVGDVLIIGLARGVLMREAEIQLRAHALLASRQISGDDLAVIHEPADMESPAFRRVHMALNRIRSAHPDFLWVYTMRYTGQGSSWKFIVDSEPYDVDRNENGHIEEEEKAVLPGAPFDGDVSQEFMLEGLRHSIADLTPYPDPFYGHVVSGYAPIYDSHGKVQGLLGIDTHYAGITHKVDAVSIAVIGMSVLLGFVMLYALYLFDRRTQTLHRAFELQHQLVDIKATFAKFVPEIVRQELERNPDPRALERQERDVTVMFVDLGGYTRLSERLAVESIGDLLERYFSRFIEKIHEHQGQVNETAGDGMMVIFQANPPSGHALDAIEAATAIEQSAEDLNEALRGKQEPVVVNIGINSGPAVVGLNRFVGISGERYTYTATGPTTNVAARIAGLAKEGDILLSEATAERVREHVDLERVGRRSLKNVGRPMMIYRPRGAGRSGHVDPAVAAADE